MEVVKPIVDSVVEGFNGTIFAYGQTASGKTYTISGDGQNDGIAVLSIKELFAQIEKRPEQEFHVSLTYLEIYNERLYDLLRDRNESDLRITEGKNNSQVEVRGATRLVLKSTTEFRKIIRTSEVHRHVGSTAMNARSSRSHTILSVHVKSAPLVDATDEEDLNSSRKGVLHLVDLAGSEGLSRTQAEGERKLEGSSINRSLLALTNCISCIVAAQRDDKTAAYVNFRDSKLTRLLSNSLGGNSRTTIICCVSPEDHTQTVSTLEFASRAKCIRNKVKVNVCVDSNLESKQSKDLEKVKMQYLKLKRQHLELKELLRSQTCLECQAAAAEPQKSGGLRRSLSANWGGLCSPEAGPPESEPLSSGPFPSGLRRRRPSFVGVTPSVASDSRPSTASPTVLRVTGTACLADIPPSALNDSAQTITLTCQLNELQAAQAHLIQKLQKEKNEIEIRSCNEKEEKLKEIAEFDALVVSLREESQYFAEYSKNLERRVFEQEQTVTELREAVSTVTKREAVLQTEMRKLRNRETKLQEERENMQAAHQEATRQTEEALKNEFQICNMSFVHQVRDITARNEELEIKLKIVESEIGTATSRAAALHAINAELRKSWDAAETKLKTFAEQLETEKQQRDTETRAITQILQEERKEGISMKHSLVLEKNTLLKDKEVLQLAKSQVETELRQIENLLESERTAFTAERLQQEIRIKALSEDAENLRSTLQTTVDKFEGNDRSLQQKLNESHATITDLQSNCIRLEKEWEQAKNQMVENTKILRADLLSAKEDNYNALMDLEEQRKITETLSANLSILEQQCSDREGQLRDANERFAVLSAHAEQLEKQVGDTKTQKSQAEANWKQAEESAIKMAAELQLQREKFAELTDKFEDKRTTASNAVEAVKLELQATSQLLAEARHEIAVKNLRLVKFQKESIEALGRLSDLERQIQENEATKPPEPTIPPFEESEVIKVVHRAEAAEAQTLQLERQMTIEVNRLKRKMEGLRDKLKYERDCAERDLSQAAAAKQELERLLADALAIANCPSDLLVVTATEKSDESLYLSLETDSKNEEWLLAAIGTACGLSSITLDGQMEAMSSTAEALAQSARRCALWETVALRLRCSLESEREERRQVEEELLQTAVGGTADCRDAVAGPDIDGWRELDTLSSKLRNAEREHAELQQLLEEAGQHTVEIERKLQSTSQSMQARIAYLEQGLRSTEVLASARKHEKDGLEQALQLRNLEINNLTERVKELLNELSKTSKQSAEEKENQQTEPAALADRKLKSLFRSAR